MLAATTVRRPSAAVGTRKKVLVVEDEKDLLQIVKYNLQKEGYVVLTARDGESALATARKGKPDLIILDVILPHMDGMEICRILRQETQVPIMFVTGKKNEIDKILGLKLGADDYLTKPFGVGELVARVQAILRRAAPAVSRADAKDAVHIGNLEVDFERHEIRVGGKPANLPPKEFELLKLLIKANGKVLSRDYLLENIWGYEKSSEIDTRTVDQHISRLRRKLQSEKNRIVTVANFGYQIKMS